MTWMMGTRQLLSSPGSLSCFITALWGRHFSYPRLIDKESEA